MVVASWTATSARSKSSWTTRNIRARTARADTSGSRGTAIPWHFGTSGSGRSNEYGAGRVAEVVRLPARPLTEVRRLPPHRLLGHCELMVFRLRLADGGANGVGEAVRAEDAAQPEGRAPPALNNDRPDAEESAQGPGPVFDIGHFRQQDRRDRSVEHAEVGKEPPRSQSVDESRAAIRPVDRGPDPAEQDEPERQERSPVRWQANQVPERRRAEHDDCRQDQPDHQAGKHGPPAV